MAKKKGGQIPFPKPPKTQTEKALADYLKKIEEVKKKRKAAVDSKAKIKKLKESIKKAKTK